MNSAELPLLIPPGKPPAATSTFKFACSGNILDGQLQVLSSAFLYLPFTWRLRIFTRFRFPVSDTAGSASVSLFSQPIEKASSQSEAMRVLWTTPTHGSPAAARASPGAKRTSAVSPGDKVPAVRFHCSTSLRRKATGLRLRYQSRATAAATAAGMNVLAIPARMLLVGIEPPAQHEIARRCGRFLLRPHGLR